MDPKQETKDPPQQETIEGVSTTGTKLSSFEVTIPNKYTNDNKVTLYVIHLKKKNSKQTWISERRYTEFSELHEYLKTHYLFKTFQLPVFPKKAIINNKVVKEERRAMFETYLKLVVASEILMQDIELRKFLNYQGEIDKPKVAKPKKPQPSITASQTKEMKMDEKEGSSPNETSSSPTASSPPPPSTSTETQKAEQAPDIRDNEETEITDEQRIMIEEIKHMAT